MEAVPGDRALRPVPRARHHVADRRGDEPPAGAHGVPPVPTGSHQDPPAEVGRSGGHAVGRSGTLARSQPAARFTSALILASSAAVSSFRAKATGHMGPSSRCALSLKPKVAYLVLNLCAPWKKQRTLSPAA